jgi:hypothetical protein
MSRAPEYGELYRQAQRYAEYRPEPRNRSEERLLGEALAGDRPAEDLPEYLRHKTFLVLHNWGWTDMQMAEHTRTSLYTTARIRDYLGLEPNRDRHVAGAPAAQISDLHTRRWDLAHGRLRCEGTGVGAQAA